MTPESAVTAAGFFVGLGPSLQLGSTTHEIAEKFAPAAHIEAVVQLDDVCEGLTA